MSNCPTTGVPAQFCTCVQCQKPRDSENGPSVELRTEPFKPVSDEMVLCLAREAQSRIDASVGAPSMVVGCYTLAALCAEVALFRAKEPRSA